MVDNLKSLLSILPPNQIIDLGNGYTVTVGWLLDKVTALKFEVYHKQFRGPGYGGANYGDRIEINDDVFIGYVHRDPYGTAYGANYLILHEIAHNTDAGRSSLSWNQNRFHDSYPSGTFYGEGNLYFGIQEATANGIALSIANAIGISITSTAEPNFRRMVFCRRRQMKKIIIIIVLSTCVSCTALHKERRATSSMANAKDKQNQSFEPPMDPPHPPPPKENCIDANGLNHCALGSPQITTPVEPKR